jgi:hypothetical protein
MEYFKPLGLQIPDNANSACNSIYDEVSSKLTSIFSSTPAGDALKSEEKRTELFSYRVPKYELKEEPPENIDRAALLYSMLPEDGSCGLVRILQTVC